MRTTISKEDYSITIRFNKNGEAYWNLSYKGESKFATKEELLMVSDTLGLLKKRIEFELVKDAYTK